MSEQAEPILDCLIIGGGPAGLTGAIYLARFLRDAVLIDDGHSRAALIPESHNYPGFAAGVSGEALLGQLRSQARHYGCATRRARVETLTRDGALFRAQTDDGTIVARRVLLATGIVDDSPDLPGLDDVIERGTLRYCPICDGYEAIDRRIGVLGRTATAARKAMFLRTYSRDVMVLPTDDPAPHAEIRERLAAAGVTLAGRRVSALRRIADRIAVSFADGTSGDVEVLYPALGCHVRADLARPLGARCDETGQLVVDHRQMTSIDGFYAAGDVVSDLHQISVATGHAAVAATAIHNSLAPNRR